MKFLVFVIAAIIFFIIDSIFYSLNRKHDFNAKTAYNIGQGSGILATFLVFLIYEFI